MAPHARLSRAPAWRRPHAPLVRHVIGVADERRDKPMGCEAGEHPDGQGGGRVEDEQQIERVSVSPKLDRVVLLGLLQILVQDVPRRVHHGAGEEMPEKKHAAYVCLLSTDESAAMLVRSLVTNGRLVLIRVAAGLRF